MLSYPRIATVFMLLSLVATSAIAQQPCAGTFSSEIDRYRCLLRARLAAPDANQKASIDALLDRRYKQKVVPFVLDLTGFSSKTRARGSAHAMMGVLEVWDLLYPLATSNNGVVLKDEGDTFYASFPDVPKAITAALAMQDAVSTLNRSIARTHGNAAMRYCTSIGVGYGDIHVIATEDAFGEQVNAAYDAGESQASDNEILLTKAAKDAISGITLSGVSGVTERNLGPYSLWLVNRTTPTICTSVN